MIARGSVQQIMTISLLLSTPAELSADGKSRSKEMADIPITTIITLTNGVQRVDVHTRVENLAKDHRLRVHFPAPLQKVESAVYDGHFEIMKRPIDIPPFDSTWVEEPRPETHQRAFTSVGDGKVSLTIANRGLPEVEVIGTSRPEIALTLLRCVGWLSRDDFSNRKGHAGPFLEAPAAQMPGEWEFDYSIIAGQTGNLSYQQAWNFESPLRAAMTDIHTGGLSSSGSFISVDNPSFLICAVKESEDGRGWIVRGYNTGDKDILVTLVPWRKFKKAKLANMSEKTVNRLKVERSGGVLVKVKRCEVVTVMFGE